MSINRVEITGNLTRDPDLNVTQGGTAVLRLGVAVNDRRRNPQTQQWEDKPNYVDCVMFGNRAQSVQPHLSKGMKVAIAGKLSWSQWQDRQTGANRSKLEVVVDDIEFMGRRDSQGAAQRGTTPEAPTQYATTPAAPTQVGPTQREPTQRPIQSLLQPASYGADIPF